MNKEKATEILGNYYYYPEENVIIFYCNYNIYANIYMVRYFLNINNLSVNYTDIDLLCEHTDIVIDNNIMDAMYFVKNNINLFLEEQK